MRFCLTNKAFVVYLVALAVLIAGIAVFNHPQEHDDSEVDVVGYWYQVGCYAYDDDKSFYQYTNENFDIEVIGMGDTVFYANSQNVDFTGCIIDGDITFEYYTSTDT